MNGDGEKAIDDYSAKSHEQEIYSKRYEEMITSLKCLHLKKTVDQRRKHIEKREFKQKTKCVAKITSNLSAADTSQNSVIKPGILNNIGLTSNLTDTILQPSKLSTSVTLKKQFCSSLLISSCQRTSSDEKTRIANSLRNPNLSLFANVNENTINYPASFSNLNTNSKSDDCKTTGSAVSLFNDTAPLSPTSSQVNHFAYRCRNDSSQNTQAGYCNAAVSYNCSLHRCNSNTCSSINHYDSHSNNVTAIPASCDLQNMLTVAAASSASSHGIMPERSCSEELRMEETNVNELASYFEDLLHIPRKMSVMAEMMYA